MEKKRKRRPTIAILTGGGDVPGLNPCIKALVNRADNEGIKVLGIKRGWAGILEYKPNAPRESHKYIQELTPQEVRTIDRSGGTHLHTSRTNPSAAREKDVTSLLRKRFKKGKDTLSFPDTFGSGYF